MILDEFACENKPYLEQLEKIYETHQEDIHGIPKSKQPSEKHSQHQNSLILRKDIQLISSPKSLTHQ